jgi:hypothetical protein
MLAWPAAVLRNWNARGECMGSQIKVPKSDVGLQTSITNLDLVASLWAQIKMLEAPLECDIRIVLSKQIGRGAGWLEGLDKNARGTP